MLLKWRAWPDMFPLSLCNKKRLAIRHMNRLLFPMTLSIPSYDIGKWIGLRTYQQPPRIQNKNYISMEKLFTGKCLWSLQYAVNVCINLHLTSLIGKVLTHKLKLRKKPGGKWSAYICIVFCSYKTVTFSLPGIYPSSKIPATKEKMSPPNIYKLCAEFFNRLLEKWRDKSASW
jgi:hypothetical protein